MTDRRLSKPIFLIGAPRSGTTLLGWIFEAHPEVAYWPEPRLVWETGNRGLPDDVLTGRHVTPEIAAEIDRRFGEFLDRSGRSRFAEKTPTNLLRVKFLHALYPDCRIILLDREPLAPIFSMAKFETRSPDMDRIRARLREMRLADLPGLVKRLFSRERGPRPPGWRDWQNLPQSIRLTRQWRSLIKTAERDLATIPPENWTRTQYADLIHHPAAEVKRLFEFAELPPIEFSELQLKEPIEPERERPEIPEEFAEQVRSELQD